MTLMKVLASNVKRLVEAKGRKLHMGLPNTSARQLYRIKKGNTDPKLSTLEALAEDLDVRVVDLLEE